MMKKKRTFNRSCRHSAGDGRGARRVYLNGKHLKNAVFADTKRGFVRVCRLDANGELMRAPDGSLILQKLRGKVIVKYVSKHNG